MWEGNHKSCDLSTETETSFFTPTYPGWERNLITLCRDQQEKRAQQSYTLLEFLPSIIMKTETKGSQPWRWRSTAMTKFENLRRERKKEQNQTRWKTTNKTKPTKTNRTNTYQMKLLTWLCRQKVLESKKNPRIHKQENTFQIILSIGSLKWLTRGNFSKFFKIHVHMYYSENLQFGTTSNSWTKYLRLGLLFTDKVWFSSLLPLLVV